MNIAVVFAGGTGKRMHSGAIPKQFLELHGKPLIVYTLEKFQNHQDIDAIVVVCLKSWIGKLEKLVNTYDLNKVRAVTPGGETPQESAFQGLLKVREFAKDDDIVLVHDGVRPLVDESTITKGIACTRKNGNAITVTPAIETIFLDNTREGEVGQILDRSQCLMARAPQCFLLGELYRAQKTSLEKGEKFIDSASLMKAYGHKLYTVEGVPENIKITTPIDFYMFSAIIDAKESSKVFG